MKPPLVPLPHIEKGLYRHRKGNEYRVFGIGRKKDTLEPHVMYYSVKDKEEVWLRPYDDFVADVDVEEYKGPRFIQLGPSIVLCGSLTAVDEMVRVQKLLEEKDVLARIPGSITENISSEQYTQLRKDNLNEFIKQKGARMLTHFDYISAYDAVLVVNPPKNGIDGYIGPNTLMEMAHAFALRKKLFVLYPVSEESAFSDELIGMNATNLNGNINTLHL